jgi:hypothetical protein
MLVHGECLLPSLCDDGVSALPWLSSGNFFLSDDPGGC